MTAKHTHRTKQSVESNGRMFPRVPSLSGIRTTTPFPTHTTSLQPPAVSLVHLRSLSRRMSERPVENAIREKLTARLTPAHVEVVNESHMHNVPEDAETHFKVLIVSQEFHGLPLLRRHRLVNEILSYELRHGIHALSIITKTPDQWTDGEVAMEPSPPCRGGFGK